MWGHGVNGAGEREKKLQKRFKITPLGFNDTKKGCQRMTSFLYFQILYYFLLSCSNMNCIWIENA